MTLDTNRKAGMLYILPVIAILVSWLIFLFVISPPVVRPFELLIFVISEKPQLLWMRWFMALPVLCLLLAASYFSQFAQRQVSSIILFIIGIAVCLVCWMSFDWWVALTATLPLIYGYLSVRAHFIGKTPAAA